MAGAIVDELDQVVVRADSIQNCFGDFEVRFLRVASDVVDLADGPVSKNDVVRRIRQCATGDASAAH